MRAFAISPVGRADGPQCVTAALQGAVISA